LKDWVPLPRIRAKKPEILLADILISLSCAAGARLSH
jgi:hypothetical protein